MSDFLLGLKCIFDNTWTLMSSINLPGTSVSIAAIAIGFFFCGFGIWFFRRQAQ